MLFVVKSLFCFSCFWFDLVFLFSILILSLVLSQNINRFCDPLGTDYS